MLRLSEASVEPVADVAQAHASAVLDRAGEHGIAVILHVEHQHPLPL